jgi:uncharacterized protein (PEP-CTERM system associated)
LAALALGSVALCTAISGVAQSRYGGPPPGTGGGEERGLAARKGGWQLLPELGLELDFTDNVDLAPSDRKRSDFVLAILPRLTILEKSAHTTFSGSIAAPSFLYARTSGNDRVRPEVNLAGNAELVPRVFFVDGAVNISQQYLSPFGAQPQSLINATNNRYTAQSYRFSPYIKGESRGDLKYELRDNNIWSNATSAPVATRASYTNELVGDIRREPRPLGWSIDYRRDETRFTSQPPFRDQIGRGNVLWLPDREIELSGMAGYEETEFPTLSTSDVIYGAGFRWHPSDRTKLDARWEHRFFGTSYHVDFSEHTRLTTWSLGASRDITTFPRQLATLGADQNVAALLDQIFASRIADPTERQTFVDQLIRDRGLPSALGSPLTLYTEQVTLRETVHATVGILGARNSVFVTADRTQSEPVTGVTTTPVDLLLLQNDTTQYGTSVVWTHKLTSLLTLVTNADWFRTLSNRQSGLRATQQNARIILSARLSPLSDVYAGVRHQTLDSTVAASSYRETAVFVGLRHFFR